MAGLNMVVISGRIGKDPEIVRFRDGNEIANFSIATSEVWTDKRSGDRREKTEWHNVKVQGEHLIKIVRKYLNKGDRILVVGKIETRSWEKDGEKRYATEVVVGPFRGEIVLIETKKEAEGGGDRDDDRGGRSRNQDDRQSHDRGRSSNFDADMDDDIPF